MKLVFVADDLGYCPKRSQGIFELFESGKISRASLMVNVKKYSVEAGKNCFRFKEKIGLHFNITEGQPLARPVPQTLVDNKGCLLGKKGFWSAHDKMEPEEIRRGLKTSILVKSFDLKNLNPLFPIRTYSADYEIQRRFVGFHLHMWTDISMRM
ncbi:unnamed protein product [Oikopleura dioica]|uniref:Carbohydrate deacetylase n=1 Tax=Oikopleura dioica TaxID=34765 RepID=E4YHG6_OIKDI|nr:unnamed protein product [Oikopleura dioica]